MRPVFFVGILLADTLLAMGLIAAPSASTLVEGESPQAAIGFKKKFFSVSLW
jgi:hypothetical protein